MGQVNSIGLAVTGAELLKNPNSGQATRPQEQVATIERNDSAQKLTKEDIDSLVKPVNKSDQASSFSQLTANLNSAFGTPQTRLSIDIHEPSKRIVVKVIDKVSGELIRQVPPEEILKMAANLSRLLQGKLVDTEV